MSKIKIHPLFLVLGVLLFFKGEGLIFINSIVAVILHELGHARVAYNRGYRLNNITLMPYGGVIYGGEKINRQDAIVVALAGPLTNLAFVTAITAIWWVLPGIYTYTISFVEANLAIAIFNILPVYPLDGSRVFISLFPDATKPLRIMRATGILLSIVFFGFFIVSILFGVNLTLLILSIMVFISAISSTQKETLIHIANKSALNKDVKEALKKVHLSVPLTYSLGRLVRSLASDTLTTVDVVDKNNKIVKTINENDIWDICILNPLENTIGDILKNE